jgi:ABC-2 type transport system permease protein
MWNFAKYEWKRWVRTPMLWIFFGVITLLVMGATSSDNISIGGSIGSVKKNSPFVVQNFYGVMSIFGLLMSAAFMSATANRDFSTGMYQFIFTSPIRRRDYYFGKFFGAFLVSIIPLLGVTLGVLIGPYMPWAQEVRFGPVYWSGHIQGIISFAIPNAFITGSIMYTLAVTFRSNLIAFVGAMVILVFYALSGTYLEDMEKEWLANLLDPFGERPMNTITKYLTVDERNTTAVALTGQLLVNRLVWMGLAIILVIFNYSRFRMGEPISRKKNIKSVDSPESEVAKPTFDTIRNFQPAQGKGLGLVAWWHMLRFELASIVRNQTFIILVIIGILNLSANLSSFTVNYGNSQYPVTYEVIDRIRGGFYLFMMAIIVFYSGVLVWKERDAKVAEIADATPVKTFSIYTSKVGALLISLAIVQVLNILTGIITQTLMGYYDFKILVYIQSLLVLDMLDFTYLSILAVLLHYLINNRYIAYFAFIGFVIVNSFIWSVLRINTNMVSFGSTPGSTYSDMNGFGPFVPGLLGFHTYWLLFAGILIFATYYFYVRGKETAFRWRLRQAGERFSQSRYTFFTFGALFVMSAAWVYYNTQIVNPYFSSRQSEKNAVAYEQQFKQYEGIPQPRWVDFEFTIDIHPYDRDLLVKADALIVNKSNVPIDTLHFTLPTLVKNMQINIPDGSLALDAKDLKYRKYALSTPMMPGDTLQIQITAERITMGFQNTTSFLQITHNGTFFNNMDIMPYMGYSNDQEITDKNKRIKLGLPPRDRAPRLDPQDLHARRNHFLLGDSDWVTMRTTISTSADQMAVAPGSLLKQWSENGRNYFRYEMDHPSLNFYSFISSNYEVARERWQDIDLEVYYIKGHEYNVPNMLSSMRRSLEYFTENFGPYYHKQCRIIEFPRYSSFAQAFPGTMPYSEGIGFITDLRKVEEEDIDLVFYVVAHEMGHQYWAHQLIGAMMQGSIMMSECFTQYAALMVMEQLYGKDKMHKFLRYEMNGYLRGRGSELEAERPVKLVENQGYIYYQKGSVVMYYLKEMIGEDKVNEALRDLLTQFAYQPPPYPTSVDALEAFKKVTPDSLQYLIDDLFERIILFDNRVVDATYDEIDDVFEVRIKTSSEKFEADSLGTETLIPIQDYIDIAIFAKPEGKAKFGQPLVYERIKIDQKENEFVYKVKQKPHTVGIDPYNYLIDRLPLDNTKKVVLKE